MHVKLKLSIKFWVWIVGGAALLAVIFFAASQTVCAAHAGTKYSFLCEAKVTDIGVAFFTYCLVIVGWFGIRSTDHSTRISERAYIYGGIKFCHLIEKDGVRYVEIIISMANYGKTAGFIKHIETGSCRLEDVLEAPFYTDCFAVSDLYFPQMTMAEVRATRAVVRIPTDGSHVVFQRVFYEDVFKRSHFSGSAYRFYPEGNEIRNEPFVAKPAYWDWDKEEE
jgi:hypothetical protein